MISCAALLCFLPACKSTERKQADRRTSDPAETGRGKWTNTVTSAAEDASKSAKSTPAPAKAPDNTAQNRIEAKADTLTPIDQGNSDLDLRTTQALRRAIVRGHGGKRFSFSAKNIKIITLNSEVTLRGVVRNQAEKNAIEQMARELQGVRKVNNQLTVKNSS
jgi:osmotically-inducible protein OsmY